MTLINNIPMNGDIIKDDLSIRQGFRNYKNKKFNIANDLFKISFKRDLKNNEIKNSLEIRNKYIEFLYNTHKIEFTMLISYVDGNPCIRISNTNGSINEYMIYKSIEYLNNTPGMYKELNMANINAIFPCCTEKNIYHLKRMGDYIYKVYDHCPMIDETNKYKNYIISHSEKILLEKSTENNVRNLLKILFKSINEDRTILYLDDFSNDILSTLNKNFLKQFFDVRLYDDHPMMSDYFKDKFL